MSVDLNVENGVATVDLNRPEAMNALDPETETELQEIFHDIAGNPKVQAVIVTGAGDCVFRDGTDLKKTLAITQSPASQRFRDEQLAPSAARSAIPGIATKVALLSPRSESRHSRDARASNAKVGTGFA